MASLEQWESSEHGDGLSLTLKTLTESVTLKTWSWTEGRHCWRMSEFGSEVKKEITNETKQNKKKIYIYPSYLLYILLTIGPHKPKQKEEKITYKCAKTQGSTFKRLWFWFSWIFILKRKDIGLTSWSQQIFQSLRILTYSSKTLWILSIQNALQFFKIKYHHTCLKLHKFK